MDEKARSVDELRAEDAVKKEEAFLAARSILGDEAEAALREHYELFDDRLYKWMAGLYDPQVGGFYFNECARDTEGFLPDIESTKQAITFFQLVGMTSGYENLIEAYPEWMREQINGFARGLQSPEDGYFYHPQWGKDIKPSRQGRDLGWATSTLRDFGAAPIWDAPNGVKGERGAPSAVSESGSEAGAVAVYPERLRSVDAFRRYLICELNGNEDPSDTTPNLIRSKSYSIGNSVGAQSGQIKQRELLGIETGELVDSDGDGIADDGFIRTFEELFNSWILPYNGLWEEYRSVGSDGEAVVDREGGQTYYNAINGLMKTSGAYNQLGLKFPCLREALKSACYMAGYLGEHEDGRPGPDVMGKRPNASVDVYNPWVCITGLVANARKHCAPEEVEQMLSVVRSDAVRLIRSTTEKSRYFKKADGSAGYRWGECGTVSQSAPVSPAGFMGGDINGGSIATRGITTNMCWGLGIPFVPMFGKAAWQECLAIFEAKEKQYLNP